MMNAADKPMPRKIAGVKGHKKMRALRSIWFLVPHCQDDPERGFEGCEDRADKPYSWHKGCLKRGHDPYYRMVMELEVKPILEPVCKKCDQNAAAHPEGVHPDGHDWEFGGKHRQTSEERYQNWIEKPNLKQVTVTERAGGGLRYGLNPLQWARLHGYIRPSEHPYKPLAEFCEYHDCSSQDLKVFTEFGNYCDEIGAKRVRMDLDETSVEVQHQPKIREQLAKVAI